MKNPYARVISTPTPQTERNDPIQVKNNAGGYVFQVSDKTRLERFLILGTEKGTYYQGEGDFTKQNLSFLIDYIKRDGSQVVSLITTISNEGRAYKNSPAIFALALVFKHGSDEAKAMAKYAVSKVCRTSTHLFELAQYFEFLGGWNRSRRSAVANWYTGKTADALAYQAVKYRQRNGWTHRDLFRLAHPNGIDKNVGNFILGKSLANMASVEERPDILQGFDRISHAENLATVLRVLDDHPNLPWEAIPTKFLKEPKVWKTLFYNGQLRGQALIRNITRLARIGAFDDMVFTRDYATKLTDEEMIQKTRLHPMNYLNAIVVHQEGQINHHGYGERRKDWNTVPVIISALNDGFYKSFKYVEPANKRTFIAVDVSGSMSSPALGLDLSCAQVAGAMAMTIARTEPYYMIRGFTSAISYGYYARSGTSNFSHDPSGLTDLGISPSMNLNDVMNNVQRRNFGSTDCSLPMEYAIKKKLSIDTFIVLTDSETYKRNRHPYVALQDYRKKSGIDARLIVVGMTATEFSIADPRDAGMLDVVGADANLPKLIADFSAGRI